MPNNSNARREKEKKKQSKKKRTDPSPLHKEDTASKDGARKDGIPHSLSLSGKDDCIMDTSSSSLSLASSAISTADSRNKDGSLPMLSLGAFKPASPLSLQAQPKSDTPSKVNSRPLSLTKEERKPVFEATKLANPNTDHNAFNEAYGIALWKTDNQKRGINPGSNLGAVDISFSSETDDQNNSGEDSDSSEDGRQVIRNDLLRQEQVSPPSSPKENRFLAGLMKSPPKLQLDEQSRPALDKEPLSLLSPTKQAETNSADANQGHKTSDVTGHGDSVSASLGFSSLVFLDNAHQSDMQTAADTIRNGSLLSLSQLTEGTGNNSEASSQVETSLDAPRKRVKRTAEEDIQWREAAALRTKAWQEQMDKMIDGSLSPTSQAIKEKRMRLVEKDLAEAKRFREQSQEKLPAPQGNNFIGQRVPSEAFCINRLDEICQFAGETKLKDFTDGFERNVREEEITHLFRRFRRENVKGYPPYFCVSASMLGRLTHTFKEEYITRDKVWRTAIELDLHVDEIVEQGKESMSQDATAIRMQTQSLIDKKSRLLLDAHNRCEAALAAVHSRMEDASKAYGDAYEEALNQQLKIVTESTITEGTLKQEMLIAANAHRDGIEKMTAIPPLFMDDTRIQLQIRCAAAEEKAEDLQRQRQVKMGEDSEGKIASLRKELEMSWEELGELRKVNQSLDEKL
jgi:hypothetical protein